MATVAASTTRAVVAAQCHSFSQTLIIKYTQEADLDGALDFRDDVQTVAFGKAR
jgi:hypothetical protein